MYQDFRREVLTSLASFDPETLQAVAHALDTASAGYTFGRMSAELTVLGRDEFKAAAASYIVTKKTEGIAASTIKGMVKDLDLFIAGMVKPLEQIKTNDVRAYLYNYQQKRGVSNRTLNHLRGIICGFFHWAAAEGYIPCDPTVNIKPIKYTAKPRKALSQFELERVRRACRTERETCIIELLYSTGCRISELCNIRIDDVDFEKREITVLGKGSKYRTVYINAKALISVQAYLASRKHTSVYLICNERGGGQLTKSNMDKLFSRIASETGIAVTPHIMRHTFATQALTGTGVEVVQHMLGHSNIATTMIYAEVNPKSIQAAHDKCVI